MSRGAAEVNGATTVPAGAAKVVDSFFGEEEWKKRADPFIPEKLLFFTLTNSL